MDDGWRPVALQVGAWLTRARRVEQNQVLLAGVERAEEWLSKAEAAMRDERFAPIATQAQAIWKTLRQESNVDLASVKLEGKATRRHVTLNVTVDGADSIAVSVMSQGELNALALSLFLPRMTLGESPFRFVVVDDPVQAMDPQKVDGLAQALEAVAKSRQVIVFTHDMRLFDAVKRLQIPAKILEVSRRPGSVVDVSTMLDPIDRYLEDAFAVACEEDAVGPTVAQRIVATFCRGALDAACMGSYSRRRLGRGDSHESVAARLAEARGAELYALAVLDDAGRGGEVMKTLKTRFGPSGLAVYQGCKEGAHGAFKGTLKDLIDGTRVLARGIERTA
jgi:ABC-type lipoprotein export system ATPase subunit